MKDKLSKYNWITDIEMLYCVSGLLWNILQTLSLIRKQWFSKNNVLVLRSVSSLYLNFSNVRRCKNKSSYILDLLSMKMRQDKEILLLSLQIYHSIVWSSRVIWIVWNCHSLHSCIRYNYNLFWYQSFWNMKKFVIF